LKSFIFILTAVCATVFGVSAFAQDGPQTVAKAESQDAIYCGDFDESESGDNPTSFKVKIGGEILIYYAGLQTNEEYTQLAALKTGTPIKLDFAVRTFYDESGGGNMTLPFVTKYTPTGAADPAACK
jgi:hypothetical protein